MGGGECVSLHHDGGEGWDVAGDRDEARGESSSNDGSARRRTRSCQVEILWGGGEDRAVQMEQRLRMSRRVSVGLSGI